MKVFSNAGPLMALGKLGHLDLLYRLFGQVGFSTSVYQEVVIRGSQRGYPDALLIEMALQREHLVVLDVIADDLPSDIASLPLDAGEKETIYLATRVPKIPNPQLKVSTFRTFPTSQPPVTRSPRSPLPPSRYALCFLHPALCSRFPQSKIRNLYPDKSPQSGVRIAKFNCFQTMHVVQLSPKAAKTGKN